MVRKMHGDSKVALAEATSGKTLDYLTMKLDYTTRGHVKVVMTDCLKNMITGLPEEVSA